MATALYRRYRPEAFAEMIGQAHVTEPLMTALRTGRVGHAYLFSGPRGCGKTTSARILARCLNCAEGPTDTPCGTCPSCVELSREGGGSLDVVEIDAASHGGVDDARELRERAVFAPARDRYKIFIIDEAHMVTSGGFNALLKIVEEPPPHIKFIFATTEPEKVIGTIRSRTHHYPFRLIAPGALIDYAQQLCESEHIEVEPGVLPLVVRAGGGSVRDTLSILDQLIAGSEDHRVALARATGLLGYTSAELIDETVAALGALDAAAAFAATDRVVQTGQDPRRFVEDLLERLRDLIVISATTVQGASAVFRGVPDDQLQRMFEQSQGFAPGRLSRIADTVADALDSMAGATAPRLQLELMVARSLRSNAGAVGPVAAASAARSSEPVSASSAASGGAPSRGAGETAPATSRSSQGEASAEPVRSQTSAVPRSPAPASSPRAEVSATPVQAAPPTPAAPETPAIDVIATLRSAREFLNTDGAGSRPPIVPLGGHPPAAAAAAAAARAGQGGGEQSADGQGASGLAPHSGADSSDALAESAESVEPGVERQGHTIGTEPEPLEARPAEVSSPSEPSEPQTDSAALSEPRAESSGNRSGPAAASSVTFDELIEVWPSLLDELLAADREAWNAVRNVQPLALEAELLTLGLASKSDLNVFKVAGAGPLREVIDAALGISVKYVPKPLPAAVVPLAAERESVEQPPQEPSPASPVAPAASSTPAVTASSGDTVESRGGAGSSAGSPVVPRPDATPSSALRSSSTVHAAPAVPEPRDNEPEPEPPPGEFGDPGFDPERDPYFDPQYDDSLGADGSDPTDAEPDPRPEPSIAEPAVEPASAPAEVGPEPESKAQFVSEVHPASIAPASAGAMPSFTRYGEAVVREVLGARFIEERPLPEGFER